MAWMIDEARLDPNQREIFNSSIDKNMWIKGFAGSGKSVLLIHKLRKILRDNPQTQTCVVVYTWSMIDMFKTGMNELGMPNTIPVITYLKFEKQPIEQKYDYIFCDEVQDLPESTLFLMKNRLKPNGRIVVAGDSNQSIYVGKVEATEIGKILNADEIGLNYVHRVTRTIINAIQKLLPSTNIFNAYHSSYIAEITSKDSKLLTCSALLDTIDIMNLDFSKFYWIDGILFRLNKVDGFNPMEYKTTKISLLKVIETKYFL